MKNLELLACNIAVAAQNARSRHWNVKGANFSSLHSLFGDIYDLLSSGLDTVSETIVALGEVPPHCYSSYLEDATIFEQQTILDPLMMVENESKDLWSLINFINDNTFDETTKALLTDFSGKARHFAMFCDRLLAQ